MTTDKQREAVRKYEQSHERVTCMFQPGYKGRLDALNKKYGLNTSPAKFAMFSADFMLNFLENHYGGNDNGIS